MELGAFLLVLPQVRAPLVTLLTERARKRLLSCVTAFMVYSLSCMGKFSGAGGKPTRVDLGLPAVDPFMYSEIVFH